MPDSPTPQDKATIDQGMALLADTLPPMWKRMYDETRKAGFDKTTAIKLLQTYIIANSNSSINPPNLS